jgi:hypothetical protein
MSARTIAEGLASAFLEAPAWNVDALARSGREALAARPRWMRALARAVIASFEEAPHDRFEALVTFIAEIDPDVTGLHVRRWRAPSLVMRESPFGVPVLATTGDLADWLGVTAGELEWLADERGLERCARDIRLQHYVYRWVPKPRGGVRLLEAPKARTKALQRRILHEILDGVPPHEAAHGFVRGRSIRTHAAVHAGKRAVLRIDLADFFLSVPSARVIAIFETIGYPRPVARALAALCTNRAPVKSMRIAPLTSAEEIAQIRRTEALARARHLPQGAPTSPAIGNLCARALDVRLQAAAEAIGAVYTRYADDLTFSGDETFARRAARFSSLVAAIALESGFVVNHRKTRLARSAQRQLVTGLVVNRGVAIPRDVYERYEAILFNCVRHGPEAQNREQVSDFRATLRGIVAHVASVQPARGQRLHELFERIEWPAG